MDVTVLRSSDARVAGSHFNKINASHMAPARHGNIAASSPSKGISETNRSPRRSRCGGGERFLEYHRLEHDQYGPHCFLRHLTPVEFAEVAGTDQSPKCSKGVDR